MNINHQKIQTALLGLAIAALSACSTSPQTQEPGFEIQLTGRSLQIVQGSFTDIEVQLGRDRFTDPITVTASELPAGVTAGAVTTTGSVATLRFVAATDAVQGDRKSITIFATANGKASEAVRTELAVRGAPGSLDTTFSGGRVAIPVSLNLKAAALAPDGGIVLVGSDVGSDRFSLARLTADGKPDPNFRGRAFNLAPGRDFVAGVVVQADGKILVALSLESQPGTTDIGVARFTPQGEPDTSFSGDGLATIQTGNVSLSNIALTPGGKIVVVGSKFNGQDRDFLLARLTPDGLPDLGSSGFITDSFGPSNDFASALALAPNGSMVVVGQTQLNGVRGFVLARYRADGSKDPGFGQAGQVKVDLGDDISSTAGTDVALQLDGKIVAVGFANNSVFGGLGVVRLQSNGQPDERFGNQGTVLIGFEPTRISGEGTSVVLEPNGRIVVASTTSTFSDRSFALARLEASGKLDLGFANAGRQITDFGGTNDSLAALLRTADGRLVLAGSGSGNLALARYWP